MNITEISKNTAAGITAAAVIAGGAYIALDTDDYEGFNETSKKITWELPSFDDPSFDLPSFETVAVERPNFDTPSFEESTFSPLTFAEVNLSDLSELSESSAYEFDFDTPTFPINRDWRIDIRISDDFDALCIDKRNLSYSNSVNFEAWLAIAQSYKTAEPIKYIPAPSGIKMITEVRMPQNQTELDNLKRNLAFYKRHGYNTALVVFRFGDDPDQMALLARHVKSCGVRAFFAFGGRERLEDEIFVDTVWFERMLTLLARECDGYIPWRRSSLHLFVPDEWYNNFIGHTLRAANPDILIFGEIYYGMTAIDHPKIYLACNTPRNCSGVMLKNFGYSNIAVEKVVALAQKTAKIDTSLPIIPVIVGERAYYASKQKNGKTFAENLEIKHKIEQRFIRGGCSSFITMSDDISDGIYGSDVTANLSQFDLEKSL